MFYIESLKYSDREIVKYYLNLTSGCKESDTEILKSFLNLNYSKL